MNSKFFLNKRGDLSLLVEIIFLVAAVSLAIGLFGFFDKVHAAIFGQKDDGSIASQNKLYTNIKKLIEDKTPQAYIIDDFFLGSDKILVGFDTDWNENAEIIPGTLRIFGGYKLYKPFKCGNAACLCLYDSGLKMGDPAKRDEGVVNCLSQAFAGKKVVFLSEGGNVAPKTAGVQRADGKGNYLFLYGEGWKLQRIYIEKSLEGNVYYTYISRIDENKADDPANLRKKQIDEKKKSKQ